MTTAHKLFAIAVALALPLSAQAHKTWLLPSETVLSAEDPWITVDAAVSNDLFYFNHVPLRLESLAITGPDGSAVNAENTATGKYRSTFDVHLTTPGTYRIAVVNAGLFANWEEDGKPKRWRGSVEKFASEGAEGRKQAVGFAVGGSHGNLRHCRSAKRHRAHVIGRRSGAGAGHPSQ
jgi:uncharacterized GH25 family protein